MEQFITSREGIIAATKGPKVLDAVGENIRNILEQVATSQQPPSGEWLNSLPFPAAIALSCCIPAMLVGIPYFVYILNSKEK